MQIEIIYIDEIRPFHLYLELPHGATVLDAILQSGFLEEQLISIDAIKNRLGIFGEPCRLETVLEEGDRIEIYQPLILSPKEARRKRADAMTTASGKRGRL